MSLKTWCKSLLSPGKKPGSPSSSSSNEEVEWNLVSGLPIELQVVIVAQLSTKDIIHATLVCRQVRYKHLSGKPFSV